MQAIILAAGMGRRLGEFTSNNTKCMVEVNGIRLIDRMLCQLDKLGLSRIVVVIGYEGEKLRDYITGRYAGMNIHFVENPVYAKTNNIYSLWLAREYMSEEDTLLLESDLIFDDALLRAAVDSVYPDCALVAKYETWMDGTMVRIDEESNIVAFIPKSAFRYSHTDSYYKTVNIYKFSRDFIVNHYLPFLEAYIRVLGENEYYEQVLRVLTIIDKAGIKAQPITGLEWYEIDDVQDLRIAEAIFAKPEERLRKLQDSNGGYWRYPGLLDFCYQVNPYFPRGRMIEELKANFEPLLRDYPSGMGVNSLLAGKCYGIRQDYVLVGNGASEIIKYLMERAEGSVGVVCPTFDEYPNRISDGSLVVYEADNDEFSYSVDDLIGFYKDKNVGMLLLVNPDNPTGNCICRDEVLRLAGWCARDSVRLVVDESFVDFADGDMAENTLLRNDILEEYPNLCVVKSISKSHGVPGLRLGAIASADGGLVDALRNSLPIWNINSFAEFYMQIFGKYEKDYAMSCDKFKEERSRFYSGLESVQGLRVIPSQAIYFMCELRGGVTSHELVLKLLTDYNILIKDCSSKRGVAGRGQYVRVAIRDRKLNDRFVEAIRQILASPGASCL